jgi:hypothetical protein
MKKMLTMRTLLTFCTLAVWVSAAELEVKDLPPAVRKTVMATLKGGEIKSIRALVQVGTLPDHITDMRTAGIRWEEKKEVRYSIESMLNGNRRDFDVDEKGALLEVSEDVSIDSVPAAARDEILQNIGTDTVDRVIRYTEKSETRYEAHYYSKSYGRGAVYGVNLPSRETARTAVQGYSITTAKTQEAQRQLKVLGYEPGAADGAMGSRTVGALKKFQADHSLPATGVLDKKTLDALSVK